MWFLHYDGGVSASFLPDPLVRSEFVSSLRVLSKATQFTDGAINDKLPYSECLMFDVVWCMDSVEHMLWMLSYHKQLMRICNTILGHSYNEWRYVGELESYLPIMKAAPFHGPKNTNEERQRLLAHYKSYRKIKPPFFMERIYGEVPTEVYLYPGD